MEELQDAIEDAQYVNAIATAEGGPRPVVPWPVPTEAALAAWLAAPGATPSPAKPALPSRPRAADLADADWVLARPIGLFLFSQFVKAERREYARINFCEEVQRLLRLPDQARADKAAAILEQFLRAPRGSDGDKDGGATIPPPERTEITETDLARAAPEPRLSEKEVQKLLELNTDWPLCRETPVGLTGPILRGIRRDVEQVQERNKVWLMRDSVAAYGEGTISLSYREVADGSSAFDHGDSSSRLSSGTLETVPEASAESAPPPAPPAAADGTSVTGNGGTRQNHGHVHSMIEPSVPNQKLGARQSLGERIFTDAERVVMESLKRDYWADFAASELFVKFRNFLWYQDRRVVPEDFYTMRVLGRGGFGLVYASKKGASGKLYAMKVMNKRRIKMKKSEQLATNERQALGDVESPFVVNLKYSFHSKDDIFLILDLMTGGDLAYHLHHKGRFPKKEAQYYAARIMLGLQDLHNAGYVYRDLKPENCLLAEDGRVKITDLGLAVRLTPDLSGAAGTRGYWAPEMLRRDRKGRRLCYGRSVDWFSFGCCVAEFISGTNPFRSEAALKFGMDRGKQTKEKAVDCATLEMDPEFPAERYEPDAADLCRRLLDKDEMTRLGAHGCEEIMAHPWFKNLNWESIITDTKRPPFIPPKDVNAASQSEIGNFAQDQQYQETVLDESDELVYKDWDWTNPHAFAAEVIEFLMYERDTGRPLVPLSQGSGCCDIL